MRSLYFLCVAALLLSGCKTTQEAGVTSQDAKASITPEVIKQCADAILEKNPTVKFEGPFFLGAQKFGQLFAQGEEVLLAAPTSTVGASNATYYHFFACAYDFHDNRLEFKKTLLFQNLMRRSPV